MLEIIVAQIKEMEDAGWIFRGKSSTACPLHVVRKPTEPGKCSGQPRAATFLGQPFKGYCV